MPLIHWLGNAVIVASALGIGIILSRREKLAWGGLAIAAVIGLLGLLIRFRPEFIVAVLPFAGVVFYSNMLPAAVALVIPCAVKLGRSRAAKIRIALLCVVLFAVSLRDWRNFLLPNAVAGTDEIDENGVCRQTSMDTCSAAAAVTLLKRFDIKATEAEVARLALTKAGVGTNRLGLYRALKILTQGRSDLRVRMRHISTEELVRENTPVIITVGLPATLKTEAEKELAQKYQWTSGIVHDVVFLGVSRKDATKAEIGEPDFGLEEWPVEQLAILFHGSAISLK